MSTAQLGSTPSATRNTSCATICTTESVRTFFRSDRVSWCINTTKKSEFGVQDLIPFECVGFDLCLGK
ncbi:hypothetical protein N7495_003582 [Penicillium taxi]|uniref:uncharacterized protein n=1 Tax=Penicillium taxi TaxID=168475 RepID=UPI0025456CFC|nr:uncharacterized protein N7495_003582 [Penicillium taxi]KAJ5898838.1 hypothetical protein N7495_003582 [Penicillium taxi]